MAIVMCYHGNTTTVNVCRANCRGVGSETDTLKEEHK